MKFRHTRASTVRTCAKCGTQIPVGVGYYFARMKTGTVRQCEQCRTGKASAATAVDSVDAKIAAFDSPAAYAGAVESAGIAGGSSSWAGGTMPDAIRTARTGDDSLVPQASALVDALRVQMPETTRTAYVPAPCGAYPIVPEVLTGFPLAMRVKRALHDDRAPVRIVVDLTVSAGVDHDSIRKRGTVALALAMMVAEQRPIDLLVLTALNRNGSASAGIVTIKIPAQPLELATACHALTATSFFRQMGYNYLTHKFQCGGGWAWGLAPLAMESRKAYCDRMRVALSLSPRDVFVPPVFLTDTIVQQPVQWMNERLVEINNTVDQ